MTRTDGTRSGASAAPGRAVGVAAAPPLEGVLSTRSADLDGAADDFGHYVHLRPLAVLRPGSAGDVAAVAGFARERDLPMVARGTGHSVDGQAQVSAGIVVDMTRLDSVAEPGPDRISVAAGATWSAVLDATLPYGLTPPVLPDLLALSVGGTLSAGGIGGTSHRYGAVVDNVRDLDVVTPAGDLVTCSAQVRPHLFDSVRGTQGAHGIIVRATLSLVSAPRHARRYLLGYRDLAAFLADQRRLLTRPHADHITGQAQLTPDQGWRYVLEVVTGFDPPHQPDDRALLAGLGDERGSIQVTTTGYRQFLDRLLPLVAELRATGSWQRHPHPRCTVMVPGRHAGRIASDVLGDLARDGHSLGPGGSVLLYPIPTARLAARNMPKARDGVTVVLGVQRTAPPDEPALLARMRRANEALRARVARIGGAQYSALATHHHSWHQPAK